MNSFIVHGQGKGVKEFDPHPALRATLSQWERDTLKTIPLPLEEGGAKRRVRVEFFNHCP
jgi:hypothetical protein